MNLKIKDIIDVTKGSLICGNLNTECKKFSTDTRKIQEGDTYIALKGETFDGNDYWKEAIDKGAETVIIEKEVNDIIPEKNIIVVKNTQEALEQIATAKRNLYKDLIVVGVTGSVGKTSTKDIIANVLQQKYKTLKTQGNFNNDIGLPLTILNLEDHEVAVIEMGMNHLGEISKLTKIAKPTLSVITNVGTAHIGNLGSRENILKAKLEILEGMELPKVVINNDNDMLNKWAKEESNIEIHTFGIKNESECMATNIQKEENSSKIIAKFNGEEIKEDIPVGGDVFVLNALCATTVGKILSLSNKQIYHGIKTFELTKKRMETINTKDGITIINDSYNASVDSMKAAIQHLSNDIKAKRKILVLGDMFELGEFSEDLHREVGKEVALNKIDKLIAIGDNAKYIIDEAVKNGMKDIFYAETRQELINKIKETMKKDDVILFKASNGMKLFEIVEELSGEDK